MNRRHPRHFGLGGFRIDLKWGGGGGGGGGGEMANRCTSRVETHTKGLHLHKEVTHSALPTRQPQLSWHQQASLNTAILNTASLYLAA